MADRSPRYTLVMAVLFTLAAAAQLWRWSVSGGEWRAIAAILFGIGAVGNWTSYIRGRRKNVS